MGLRERLTSHLRDPLYWNGYALVANAGVGAALGFVFWIVAARRFAPEDLGWGAAVVSAATLAALLGKAGFDAALIRFAPSAHPRVARKLVLYAVASSVALTGLVCLGIAALALTGVESLAPMLTPLSFAGFLLLACGTSAAWMLDAFFIAEQASVVTLLRNVAFHGVKLLVPLAIVASLAHAAVPLAWSVGLAASLAVALALLPRHLRRHRAEARARPSRREVASYAAKNYMLNLAEFLPGLVLPLVVLEVAGAQTNARFYLAWTVATVGFLASKAIAQSAFAALVRDPDATTAIRKGARLSVVVLGAPTLALAAFPSLALSLFGPAYGGDAADMLRLLALSIPAVVATNLYLAYLKARHAGWELTVLPTLTLVGLLALAFPALAWGGLAGVGAAWLLVQTTAGAYAATRLLLRLRKLDHDAPRTALRAHPHQG